MTEYQRTQWLALYKRIMPRLQKAIDEATAAMVVLQHLIEQLETDND
jgi:hypothetical protein